MYFIQTMGRVCVLEFFLLSFTSVSLASNTNLIKVPQSRSAAGVFMLIEGEKYTFNFTAARAACLFWNVTIATRAQMERAVQHGLETCKFGWTAEQIAVVPRLTADKNCGKGKTGAVTWVASADRKFGVFCFNASDLEEASNTSTVGLQAFTHSATPAALTQTSTPAKPLPISTSKSPPLRNPRITKAPEKTSSTSAFALLSKAAQSTIIPSTSTTLKTFSTHISTSVSQLITSKPAVLTFTFSTSVQSNFSVSSEPTVPLSVSPTKRSLGDVPTAFIILGIILLLLTAAGVVWHYKLNIFTFWPQGRQRDDTETEMWKHTDSEMDLHTQIEREEEELDRKYSSDIMLCVNPHFQTNA